MSVTFLTGPAGTGKTTQAVEHLHNLLAQGVPAHTILVLLPQLTLAQPYRLVQKEPSLPVAGAVDILTLNGLATRTIDLFWPLAAVSGGFGQPHSPPVFLDIEQSQFYLRQAIDPLLKDIYFNAGDVSIVIPLPRLMGQILDNLNKAALRRLPHIHVSKHLAAAQMLDPGARVALEQTQVCMNRFREFCLARNVLDFSLRVDTFAEYLWPVAGVQQYLTGKYRHLIVDNVEEDTPFAHTVLRQWLPQAESALVVNDEDAGYRIFLGANWRTAEQLASLADMVTPLRRSVTAPSGMLAFGQEMADLLEYRPTGLSDEAMTTPDAPRPEAPDLQSVVTFERQRFYSEMLAWVTTQVANLVRQGTPPGQIVVLAPFVSDALRFAFADRLSRLGLRTRSYRPSRPLSQEPPVKTMLTLARLAFGMTPDRLDVMAALTGAIAGLDLVRASLLTQIVYRPALPDVGLPLTPFADLEGDACIRISMQAGERFDRLRDWLLAVQSEPEPPPLDHFWTQLFGELLSQPEYRFHNQLDAGGLITDLIESARQFRHVAEQASPEIAADVRQLNRVYLQTVQDGLVAAQSVRRWEQLDEPEEEAVLITPATTFLINNRPVDYQFWLDAGSSGWWERIAQPLTHPYVLAADWPEGRVWNDTDEAIAQRDRLARLLLGLTRRCRKHIFISYAEIGEQGYEQRGQLLVTLQRLLRRRRQE
jgi:hypothetical protein